MKKYFPKTSRTCRVDAALWLVRPGGRRGFDHTTDHDHALEAGTLPQRISSSKKNLITNLKIIGEINGTDLKFIREMAGEDIKDHSTDGKLSILDLYDAKYATGFSPFGILRKRLWLLPHMA